jgi:hypothetical protein
MKTTWGMDGRACGRLVQGLNRQHSSSSVEDKTDFGREERYITAPRSF